MITSADLSALLDDNTVSAVVIIENLEPVVGSDSITVIYPPTFRGTDTTSTHVINTAKDPQTGVETLQCTFDTPQSQANRLEPIFKNDGYRDLVPEITVTFENSDGTKTVVDLLEIGHRIADASMRHTLPVDGLSIPELLKEFSDTRDIRALARVCPTSLGLGFWDSRGSGMKWPRVVKSTIEAQGVLGIERRGHSYNPPADPRVTFSEEEHASFSRKVGKEKAPLSSEGLDQISDVVLGGVLVGPTTTITRRTIVNLATLRRPLWEARDTLRRAQRTGDKATIETARERYEGVRAAVLYIFGISLVIATAPQDGDLRQGCQLVRSELPDSLKLFVRYFDRRVALSLPHEEAINYARKARDEFFGKDFPAPRHMVFDRKNAIKAMSKKDKTQDGTDEAPAEAAPKRSNGTNGANGSNGSNGRGGRRRPTVGVS